MYRLKHFHLACGIIALIAFVLSGQYMAIFLNGLQDMADGPRLMYRSAHLYLLWASLVNLIVGARFPALKAGATRYVQIAASMMLLVVPVLILIGFATESHHLGIHRPFTICANYLVLVGVLLHLIASRDGTQPDASNKQSS
jgi:hypothetical protein